MRACGTFFVRWGRGAVLQRPLYLQEGERSRGGDLQDVFIPRKTVCPRLFGTCREGDDTFLLMEFVEGENLQRPTKRKLLLAVRALAAMQEEYWQNTALISSGLTFEKSFSSLKQRRQYLLSPLLERHFDEFLALYERLPRTLCHDDLLPFNLIVNGKEERAVLLDWEAGGILPYPVSFARLIAHGREHYELFRMTKSSAHTPWSSTLRSLFLAAAFRGGSICMRSPTLSLPKRASGCSSETSTGGKIAPTFPVISARRCRWRAP